MDIKYGSLCWDVDRLFTEIKNGLKKCKELGKIPATMGIDTWGVDYVLLDEKDQIFGDTVGYRDSRTNGMDEKVYEKISLSALYERTGIQKQIFNTIYQLMAVKETHPEYLEQAKAILMIPDYFHFLLTGVKKNEYTNATTGQLVNPTTKDWDYELLDMLGYNKEMFQPVSMPGTVVGEFTQDIQNEVGFNCKVVSRKNNFVVYLKESEQISDLLSIIGAHNALLSLQNTKIVKAMRNNVNRIVNCETANLSKTVNASVRQIENIKLIQDTIGISSLPENLQEIARIRLECEDMTLKELGEMLEHPIGKSGVNHRLRKIEEIANDLRSKQE